MTGRIAKISEKPGLLFIPIPDRIERVEKGLLPFNSPALLFFSEQSASVYINAPWVEMHPSLGPWHRLESLSDVKAYSSFYKDPTWRNRMMIMHHREITLLKSHALINGMLEKPLPL